MPQQRELRFHIPLLIFLASLVWGLIADPKVPLVDIFKCLATGARSAEIVASVIGLIAAGSVVIIAAGFVIAQVALCILNRFFHDYEMTLSATALEPAWKALGTTGQANLGQRWEATILYVHGLLRQILPALADWLERRWTSFLVCVNSIAALILSVVMEVYFRWHLQTQYCPAFISVNRSERVACEHWIPYFLWILATAALCKVLLRNARAARSESMRLIEFTLISRNAGAAALTDDRDRLSLQKIEGRTLKFGLVEAPTGKDMGHTTSKEGTPPPAPTQPAKP